jgi:hypothetical protein
VDVFDPQSSTWSTLGATNPKPRAAAGAALAGGKIYLIGGCVDGACTDSADVVRFDPASGAFSAATAYPHTSSWMSCGGISDKVYCAGGVSTIEHTDGFAYDPASDSWSPIAGMPLDLWGSAHAAAGGLLVIMGGVTDSSTAITNRTVGYDPVTDTWMDLPDNAFGRFRSAGACGAFKVGGSIGNFVGTADSETLGGLGDCTQEQADVPWLASDPASFTLAPGASQAVTVTLTATAAAGVAQPGTYTAQISVAANSPYPVASIPVQLTALPPASWGKAQGTVTGKACNGTSVPLPAVLRFNSVADPTVGYTVLADAAGHFAYWLPRGRYDVIIAKDGWIPEVHRIQITAGSILTHDVPLSPIVTCR